MRAIDILINDIVGIGDDIPRLSAPSDRWQWFFCGAMAALAGLIRPQLFVFGDNLNDRGVHLTLRVCGLWPVMQSLLRRQFVLALGGTTAGENALRSFLPRAGLDASSECRIALSLNGASIIFGICGRRRAVAYWPTTIATRDHMIRQKRGLMAARTDLASSDLIALLPETLRASDTHLVLSAIDGEIYDPTSLSQGDLTAVIFAGLEVAAALHRFGQERKEPFVFVLQPEPDAVSTLPAEERGVFYTASTAVQSWLRAERPYSVPAHGDFWIGNLGLDRANSRITGIIDWEWYESRGGPFLDAIHLIVMSVAHQRGKSVADVLPALWSGKDEALALLLSQASRLFEVEQAMFQWMGILEWLTVIAHGMIDPRPTNFDAWLSRMINQPGKAIIHWLTSQGKATFRNPT